MRHRALSAEARGLIASQLVFNIGFYAVMPFLVVILRDDHAQSAAAIGVVLGARTLSQQGLFLVGGALADRWGSRPMIVLGCWVRAVGLWGLLVADGFAALLASAVVIGIGGALFSPALEAQLSRQSTGSGVSPFVWLMTIGEVGAALGPLLGVWLLARGSGSSLIVAAVLFAVMSVLTITTQLPIHRWLAGRSRITSIRLGFLSMGLGFVLVAIAGTGTPVIIASVVLMGLGHLILTPSHQQQVLDLMHDDNAPGAHLGLLATTGGLAVFAGNWLLGGVTDQIGAQHPMVWVGLGLWCLVPVLAMPGVVVRSTERNTYDDLP